MSLDIDATRLSLLLNDLRLPAIKQIWSSFAERSDTEGWPAARLLMALAEHEIAERDRRRSNVTSGTQSCCRARRWRTSISTRCRWCPARTSRRFALATAGCVTAPT